VHVLNDETFHVLHTIPKAHEGMFRAITTMVFASSTAMIVTASLDGTAKMWDHQCKFICSMFSGMFIIHSRHI
jgi:hypothetical protein